MTTSVGTLAKRLARPSTAWTLLAVNLTCVVAFTVILYSPLTPHALFANPSVSTSDFFVLPFAAFSVVGVMIALRKPDNIVGWLCLIAPLLLSAAAVSSLTGSLLLYHGSGSLAAYVLIPAAVWSGSVPLANTVFVLIILFFPDGHLPSARWRWVLGAYVGVTILSTILALLNTNPGQGLGIDGHGESVFATVALARFINTVNAPLGLASGAFGFVIVVSLFLRLRGASSEQRHQITWVAAAAALTTITLAIVNAISPTAGGNSSQWVSALVGGMASLVGFSIPIAVGVAMLKYRLYDIDVIISRALVYAALATFITAVYIGIAVGIGTLVGSGGQPNLWLSIIATIIVAVGFQPVRERVQKVANRLVYGRRATPYEVLTAFSGQVADTYAADEVLPRMARVLHEGTGAESATVWLCTGTQLRAAAAHPETETTLAALTMPNGTMPEIPGATSVRVEHQGRLLGALSVVKRKGESLTPTELKLIQDLAHQAGLVLRNVGLAAELRNRLDELRSSRQRLVRAQDEERRRLERNLHDGAQQHLVALKVKLGVAQMLAGRSPDKARVTVAQLKADADEALETLRDLARGIYPPLLADKGLVVALESQARKATLPVAIEAEHVERYSQDVEATVYFCVLEALQNVQKYANATRVLVRLRGDEGRLSFKVEDDGAGFDAATATRGAGLTNMVDRVDALGGSVDVTSAPGAGTWVHGDLPSPVRDPVLA